MASLLFAAIKMEWYMFVRQTSPRLLIDQDKLMLGDPVPVLAVVSTGRRNTLS
jgi:hypothetical protein